MISLDDILILAEKSAKQAGKIALDHFGLVQARYKAGNQIVTDADRQCQADIIDAVRKAFPEHGFIAEENDDPSQSLLKIPPRDKHETWWIIDPIDGTRNYAFGVPLFAVSIGIVQQGMPLLGVIYDPIHDELYAGGPQTPSRCNNRPITCRDEPITSNSPIAIQGHFADGPPVELANFYRQGNCNNLGTAALHFAYVANGAYSAALGWHVKLWDIAGGAAIALGAGAVVSDLQGINLFPFDCHNYSGGPTPIAMAGPSTHLHLVQLMQKKKNL